MKFLLQFKIISFFALSFFSKLICAENEETMLIAVGSTNAAKVLAVEEVLLNNPRFANSQVIGLSVSSHVSDQPLSLQETILGAKNRAKNAFEKCDCQYSFAIESGLIEAWETASGYLHVSVCCIYDGIHYHIGLSSGFEIPPQILDLILNKKMDLSQACLHSGITGNTKIGSAEGLIGVLTKGKMDRKEYSKQSVMAAILQLENYAWYAPYKEDNPSEFFQSSIEISLK